jgi:hypothetical protein
MDTMAMARRATVPVLIAAMCLGGSTAFGQASEIRCSYSRKVECTATGCRDGVVGAAYLLVPDVDHLLSATIRADSSADLPNIRRCDSKGCTPVAVRAALSGAFVNISQADGAYFMKVSTVDVGPELQRGDFVEVASQLLATLTYFGKCPALVK